MKKIFWLFILLLLPLSFTYGLEKTISTGEEVDLAKHLVKGKFNLLKFTANW